VFVTNNSTKSRKQYGKKFESLGLDVTEVSAAEFTVFFGGPCLQYRYVLDCMVCFLVLPNEFNKLHTVLQEEIFASSFAAAAYLKSINFPSDKKVQAFLSLDTLYEQLNFSVPS
jgi:phosphoglycolate phosphatase